MGRPDPAPGEDREEQEDRRNAGETELLAHDAEDEVGMRRGQEEQLLMARSQAHAGCASGAEPEQRLHRLVAVPARIGPGIEEGEHPLQPVPRAPDQERGERRGQRGAAREPGEPRTRNEEERERHARHHHRGAEIGLQQQERGEQRENHQVRKHADREDLDAILLVREGAGEPQDQRDLRQLAGLELHARELQPPPRAARHVPQPRNVHQQEQQEREPEQGDRELLQPSVAELEHGEQREKPQHRAGELALEEPEPIAQPRAGIHRRGAVDHHHAQHGEQEHRAEQHRVVAQRARGLPLPGRPRSGRRVQDSPRTSSLNWSPRSSKFLNWS